MIIMKNPIESELAGMTINERLYAMGLLNQWDSAANAKDRSKMIDILKQCALSEKQCIETVDTILKNPKKYGFKE